MRRCELKQARKGNHPNHAESLSTEEEDRLWLTGQLGTDSADMLQNTLWSFVTTLLVFKGSYETRQLQWDDLKFREDENTEFSEFTERETKTRIGNSDPTPFAHKMFPNLANPSKCPVKMHTFYCANRLQKCHTKTHHLSQKLTGTANRLSGTAVSLWAMTHLGRSWSACVLRLDCGASTLTILWEKQWWRICCRPALILIQFAILATTKMLILSIGMPLQANSNRRRCAVSSRIRMNPVTC